MFYSLSLDHQSTFGLELRPYTVPPPSPKRLSKFCFHILLDIKPTPRLRDNSNLNLPSGRGPAPPRTPPSRSPHTPAGPGSTNHRRRCWTNRSPDNWDPHATSCNLAGRPPPRFAAITTLIYNDIYVARRLGQGAASASICWGKQRVVN